MILFDHPAFDDHEQVVFCSDAASGLRAIVAVHDTTLGPALGGCRMYPYASDEEALTDVLRLSRGMTYKAAMADLALGGGKSVIMGDPRADKSEALLTAFGQAVERLGGRYITAEDVGTTVPDMDVIRRHTAHVSGVSGEAGNPSPSTAHGVFIGIRAAVRHKLGRSDLSGLRIAVQGLGSVGYNLCRYLAKDGARLVVADVNPEAVARAEREFGAAAVGPEEIMAVEADVLSPCALGGALNDGTVPRLHVPIVAGAANNQLAEDRHGQALFDRGILYAPDYVINAGGLMDVARFPLRMDIETARVKLRRIGDTLGAIFARSDAEGRPTNEIADRMAVERLQRPGAPRAATGTAVR